MLLDAIVIVLRETLEAGILVSLLLTIANAHAIKISWLIVAIITGLVGAWVYATSLGSISEWFSYTGQEVVNASLQFLIYLCVLNIMVCITLKKELHTTLLTLLLVGTVSLALIREGSEIILFSMGAFQGNSVLVKVMTSGFIGLMIGLSVGVLFYFLVISFPTRLSKLIQMVMLTLMTAGMIAQAAELLVQSDWLPASTRLWDTSHLLPERSISGQVAYAILGYEATPSPVVVGFYLGSIVLIVIVLLIVRQINNKLMTGAVLST
jgi:high-affinity iron transporter